VRERQQTRTDCKHGRSQQNATNAARCRAHRANIIKWAWEIYRPFHCELDHLLLLGGQFMRGLAAARVAGPRPIVRLLGW